MNSVHHAIADFINENIGQKKLMGNCQQRMVADTLMFLLYKYLSSNSVQNFD